MAYTLAGLRVWEFGFQLGGLGLRVYDLNPKP